ARSQNIASTEIEAQMHAHASRETSGGPRASVRLWQGNVGKFSKSRWLSSMSPRALPYSVLLFSSLLVPSLQGSASAQAQKTGADRQAPMFAISKAAKKSLPAQRGAVESFAADMPTREAAGFRMEGSPSIEVVFGDIALYRQHIDTY